MASVVTVNQPMVTVQNATVQNVVVDEPGRAYVKSYKRLGDAQVSLGFFSILLASTVLILTYQFSYPVAGNVSYSSPGIWCGVFFIIAGAFGLYSAKYPIPSRINGTMFFSIVSAILAFIMICIEGTASTTSSHAARDHHSTFYYSGINIFTNNNNRNVNYQSLAIAVYALHISLTLIAVIEFIVAIVTSGYCCSATCCGNKYQRPSAVVTTTTTTTAPVMVQQPPVFLQQPAYQAVPPHQMSAPPHGYGAVPMVNPPPQQLPYAQPGYVPQPAYAPQSAYTPQPAYAPQVDQPPAYSPPQHQPDPYPTKN